MLREGFLPVAGAAVIAVTPAYQQATDTVLHVPDDVASIVEYGLGYLLVVVLLIPLMRWVLSTVVSSMKDRDQMLRDMIEEARNSSASLREAVRAFKDFERGEVEIHKAICDRLDKIASKLDS